MTLDQKSPGTRPVRRSLQGEGGSPAAHREALAKRGRSNKNNRESGFFVADTGREACPDSMNTVNAYWEALLCPVKHWRNGGGATSISTTYQRNQLSGFFMLLGF